MEEQKKRRMTKIYFASPNAIIPISIAGVGIFLLLFGFYKLGALATLTGVVLFVALFGAGMPSDSQIDSWFREDLAQLQDKAMKRLGLDRTDLQNDPVVIVGPIWLQHRGIPNDEILWKRGQDKVGRFSINHVTIIFLTEHYLNSYSCYFNFLRNVALNEHDSQYHYKSVVAVSMGEASQSFTLKTGEKLVHSQNFSLSFTSGDKISVMVSAQELKDLTNAEIPTTGVEKAVSTIKAMLKSKL